MKLTNPLVRLDVLVIALCFIFMLDIIAIATKATEASFITVCGAVVTLVGYAFVRAPIEHTLALNSVDNNK